MAELVDALGLGSSVFGRGGSSPFIDITTCAGKINQNAVVNLGKLYFSIRAINSAVEWPPYKW